jgi:hypothetical protein
MSDHGPWEHADAKRLKSRLIALAIDAVLSLRLVRELWPELRPRQPPARRKVKQTKSA